MRIANRNVKSLETANKPLDLDMLIANRKNVLCIGSLEIEKGPFEERHLHLFKTSLDNPSTVLNEARALIIAEPHNRIGAIRECLSKLKSVISKYSLHLSVITDDVLKNDDTIIYLNLIRTVWRELEISDTPNVFSSKNIRILAQNIFEFEVGPPKGNVKILPDTIKLSPEKNLLLCRAFSDCEYVYLKKLDGGKDSFDVFSIDALLKQSVVGPRPLPYFIKFSEKSKSQTELFNYKQYAEFFIPFYLRPNIDKRRCVNFENMSAIVGNFVEDAQPLRRVLRANTGPGILFSLFENSLKGFRLQPFGSHSREDFLDELIKRRARAARFLGRFVTMPKRWD